MQPDTSTVIVSRPPELPESVRKDIEMNTQARAEQLMAEVCEYYRQTGNRRVPRNEVAQRIGLGIPLIEFTPDFRVYREAAYELRDRRYILGKPVNFEWLQLTDAGISACDERAH